MKPKPASSKRLAEYRRKRSFASTPEPSGDGRPARRAARFVVHEHHATRLHWDLRLERDGALASWAIPNGIPEDPKHNRKAIHVEDHPLDYLDFEGEIPQGQYGAGEVSVWDRGAYTCEKWRPDEVIVTFEGKRLRGRYALFHAGRSEKDWMIHRMDPPVDPSAQEMPEFVQPMLARVSRLPAEDSSWAFEVKWDGVRAVACSQPGRIHLWSRNRNEVTAAYPELRALNRALGSHSAILDGEIVAFDSDGRPSFELLQTRMHVRGDAVVRRLAKATPVTYVLFDLVWLDGHSLMGLPFSQRRELLDGLGLQDERWLVPEFHVGDGEAFLAATREQGLEGIVAKRLDSRYAPGGRDAGWLKVKHANRQEFVIGGYTTGKGARAATIGALHLGVHAAGGQDEEAGGQGEAGGNSQGGASSEAGGSGGSDARDGGDARDDGGGSDWRGASDEGGALRYAGKVGTGFDDAELERLVGLLKELKQEQSPFVGPQPPSGAHFVEPKLVCEVAFGSWTKDGILRHSVYKGLREDKDAAEVVSEQALAPPRPTRARIGARGAGEVDVRHARRAKGKRAVTPGGDAIESSLAALLQGGRKVRGGCEVECEGRLLKLTNLEKILYPKTGFTKGDLIGYYLALAPAILPHLRGRPLTLKRYPDGVEGESFFEKHCPSHRPKWVKSVPVWSANEREVQYCLCEDLPTLVWLANLAAIELHPSLSRANKLERPSAIAFDLDPGAPAAIVECCRVALRLRDLFSELGLSSYPKTSGSKGVQVYVPLGSARVAYEQTKPFAHAVADLLEQRHPELVVSRMVKARRRGKVLIDWSQNDEHKTTVAAYSLRARPAPSASTPLLWEEVEGCADSGDAAALDFDPRELPTRLAERGDLFAPVESERQRLPKL
ncbi:MAG TPA: non-homologous end-joining DNA ligase [Solirubrobacteraceae bacterium]|nr:non-homologous end-joining DNA ligase [Solirubrobacteraceae bacterium]